MAYLEEFQYREQSNLPAVEILTSPFQLGGALAELSPNKLTGDEERIGAVFKASANEEFMRTLYDEMVKRRTGLASESVAFPTLLEIDGIDDAYYKKREDVGYRAFYEYKGNHYYQIQPNIVFEFQTGKPAESLNIRTVRSVTLGKQELWRRFSFIGTDNHGSLGFKADYESRILELLPVAKGEAKLLAADANSLISEGEAGEMNLYLKGLTPPSANEYIKKWGVLVIGDRGEIFKGYVDLSEFRKKIIVENTVLTNRGIETLILRNLPKMLPLEKSSGTVYRLENSESSVAVAEADVTFGTLLPRF